MVKNIEGLEFKKLSDKDRKTIYRLIEWLKYAEIIEIHENEIVSLKKVLTSKNKKDKIKEEALSNLDNEEVAPETIVEEKVVQLGETKKVQKGILLNLTINIQIDSNTNIQKIREIIRVIKQDLVEDNNE